MKKTAVQWLIEQLTEIHPEAFEKAKAMEKEQIIYAYLKDRRGEFDVVLKLIDDAEQYYTETYEQSEQG